MLIDNTSFDGNTATTGNGGALWSSGAGTVLQSTFQSNQAAGSGGAIYAAEDDFALSVSQSLFEQNAAGTDGSGNGGAIWTSQRRVEIAATQIWQNNRAANDGGGVYVAEGFLAMSDSLVAWNTATSGRGGGIFVDASAELSFTNSTMSGNAARQAGGGFYFNGVKNTIPLVNATIAGNRADSAGATGIGRRYLHVVARDPAPEHDRCPKPPRDRHDGLRH